jgi:SET domain-containing protein
MKTKLYTNPKIEVRESTIHGYGVFAKDFIKKDELLEECHWVRIPKEVSPDMSKEDGEFILRYLFQWPKIMKMGGGSLPMDTPWVGAAPFGFGQIYNSRDRNSTPNADWETNVEINLFEFSAIKDIQKDEEILIDYSFTLSVQKWGSVEAAIKNYDGWHESTQVRNKHRTKPTVANLKKRV